MWYPGQEIDWLFQMGNPHRMLLIAPVYQISNTEKGYASKWKTEGHQERPFAQQDVLNATSSSKRKSGEGKEVKRRKQPLK